MGPEEVLTFLMTDVVGSSRLAEQDPGKYLELLRAHDALIRNAVQQHGGNCIRERGEGDSTFSVFTNPDEAVDAATQIVEQLRKELSEINLRLAIHSGTATPVDHDYRGDAPNRCARIRSLAHPGQILVSGVTFALARNRERLVEIGKVSLKGLKEKVDIYQVKLSDSESFPKVRGVPRHNLPALIAPPVPRPKLVAELLENCRAYRLVVLEGVVGVGKSTLMQLAGREGMDEYLGGVWWLGPSESSPASLIERLSHAMNLEVGAGTDHFQKVVANLGTERVLVLADGVNGASVKFGEEVQRLLEAVPTLRVVVTADRPLDLANAKRFVVPPMKGDRNGEALDYAYRRLDQMGIALPSDREAEQEFEKLLAILGGLPLAIELILPRLHVMSAAQISARLQSLVGRPLKGAGGVGAAKYDSVRSAILASLDGLSAAAQQLAKELAVLPGAFDLEMVIELFSSEERDELDLAEQVQEIVRASLLQVKTVEGTTVFEWLPVIRMSLVESAGDCSRTKDRLLGWALGRAEKFLAGDLAEPIFERFFSNLKWALAETASDETAAEVQKVLKAMRRVWLIHGPIAEALATHSLLEKAVLTHPSSRADILNAMGIFHWYSGDSDRAGELYMAALSLWESANDKRGQGASLNNLGLLALSRMDFQTAQSAFARASKVFEEANFPELRLIARQNLAASELRMSPGSATIARWRDLLVECRDDDLGRLNLLSNLFESSVLGSEGDEGVLGWLRLIHMEGNRWVYGPAAITILCSLALWLGRRQDASEDPLLCCLLVQELSSRTGMVLDSTHRSVLASASLRSIPESLLPEFDSVAEIRWAAIDLVESVLIGAAGGLIESLES